MKINIKIKPRFFIALLILGYVVFASYYLMNQKSNSIELKTPEGEKVEVVDSNSNQNSTGDTISRLKDTYKDKMTIIFFYDGYKSQEKALSYIKVLKEALVILEPFKSSSDTLLYKTFTTDSQKCDVKNNQLICSEKLIESFKNLGVDHFKVVILSPLDFQSSAEPARGKNSWITVSTFQGDTPEEEFNRFLGAQFAQNLGRSLGLSLETGSNSIEQNQYSKLPNCASSEAEAEEWWGPYTLQFDTVGYYSGCGGSATSVYPEQGTLMSDSPVKESYGVVSEDYLRGIVQCMYGNKNSISYPAGRAIVDIPTAKNCEAFRGLYPTFWEQ